MSDIIPSYQEYFTLPDNTTIGVTRFKVVETNNSVPVGPGLYTSEGAAGLQLRDANDVAQTGWFYLQTNGTFRLNNVAASLVNKDMTIVTYHKTSNGAV